MNDEALEHLKDHDPSEDASRMGQQVAEGFGIPEGTSMWQWPRRPVGGSTKGGKGKSASKGRTSHRAARSHGKKAKHPSPGWM